MIKLGKQRRGNSLICGMEQNNQGKCLEIQLKKTNTQPLEMKGTSCPERLKRCKVAEDETG